jgi:flagellar biosynthetic protein FliP
MARSASAAPRWIARAGLALAGLTLTVAAAHAQSNFLDGLIPEGGASVTGRIVQLVVVLTVLSVAPGLLIMVTSFTRFAIALSFLRSGLGLQSTPANLVLISLSLFMTFYVMAPTFDRAWQDGVRPLLDNQISEQDAYSKITDPFRAFMLTQVRPQDLRLFEELDANRARAGGATPPAATPAPPAPGQTPPGTLPSDSANAAPVADLRVLIPAFMVSELRRAFEIGFLIVLPFLVIDIVVGTLVMSMGMMMMPPVVLALPFKILFFILIDGWNLLIGGLVRSYF